ncbi:hypothetical protein BDW62DRAFT_206086 [Aspergillus aurantiobrunneus]
MNSEYAASREGFELFRRLLRVARLLDANKFDELYPQGALTPSPSIRTGNTPRNIAGVNVGGGDDEATHGSDPGDLSSSSSEFDDSDEEYYEDDDKLQLQGEVEPDVSTSARISEQTPSVTLRSLDPTADNRPRGNPEKKKPKRPCPHAAVEKRYRPMVNSKIQQLNALIPASNMFTPGISDGSGAAEGPGRGAEEMGSQKMPTKSVVLDRGLQYTNHLIAKYERCETEGNELRRKLQQRLDISAVDGDAPGTVDGIE